MKLTILSRSTITRSKTIRATLLLFTLLLAAGIPSLYYWLLADLPPVHSAAQRKVRPTTQILDRNGRLLYEVLDPDAGKQINLRLETIPQSCIDATLATEDSRFFLHPGFDPIAIARAAWQNYRAGGTVVSGGSTLTQQLARNLLLPPAERYEQSLRRKLREAWLAWRLERHFTKDELLALYLNQTYYGNFAFGLEAAGQVFFAKPAAQLSRGECALLAGLVQYPTGYNPLNDPIAAKSRQQTVLRLMHESGYITEQAASEIALEPLRYRSRLFDIDAPHFVMYVQDKLVQPVGPDRIRDGGLRITTSIDLNLQQNAEDAVNYRLDLLNCRTPGLCDAQTDPNRRVSNAAAVILDNHTGDILAMVGSPDYFNDQIQGNVNAALSLRQPGSAIKPLTYAAAMDPTWSERSDLPPLTPATILPDLPVTFYVQDDNGGNVPYQPLNYDRQFHGPVTVRTALANSYNIPAVKVLDRIGVETLRQLATMAGISTFTEEYGLALTLGGGEVKLLDLTAAYGIFRDGSRLQPHAILKIEEQRANGNWHTLYTLSNQQNEHPDSVQVIAPETAYLITDILSDPIARIPAFGENSVVQLPFPVAVKTGTTTDWRDNWTLGYSTERIVGVWVGNADNAPMLDVSGIDGAGPIWRDLMNAAHPQPPPDFPRPDNIIETTICGPSGMLPSQDCLRTKREHFIAGTEPTEPDTQFQRITIDAATGLIANEDTPTDRRVQRLYWNLPPRYTDWMIENGIPLPPPSRLEQIANPITSANSEEPSGAHARLQLTAPTSHSAYQIHPSLPIENQRIKVSGFVADGRPWAELRLIKDGLLLARAEDASRLETWWTFAPGTHIFWMEGKTTDDNTVYRSENALVVITPYQHQEIVNTTN